MDKRIALVFLLLVSLVSAAQHRIVSLGPAVTNQIMLAGMSRSIVGKTSYCDSSAGVPGTTVEVGSLLTLSVESIASLRPTIVFASGLTPPKVQNQLKNMGIRVVMIDDPKSFSHLCSNFRTITRELGIPQRGDSITAVCQKEYAQLKRDLYGKFPQKTFVQLGDVPLYTIIKGTLGDELITLIGGKNVFDLTKSGEVSRESVVLSSPDIILLADMGYSTKDEITRWRKYSSVSAVRKNRIYVVNAGSIGSPTPVSFIKTVKTIRRQIGFAGAK